MHAFYDSSRYNGYKQCIMCVGRNSSVNIVIVLGCKDFKCSMSLVGSDKDNKIIVLGVPS